MASTVEAKPEIGLDVAAVEAQLAEAARDEARCAR
jgi:hypothetical protein